MSTIRNAHYIYVLDQGHVIEQGTHQTLMEQEGKYRDLVKAQQMEHDDEKLSIREAEKEDEKEFCA